jgi:O-antigen/teichoic acid export membrane protein
MPADLPLSEGVTAARLPRRRGAKIYLAGSVVGQMCALLRYTLLARLLGPHELGLVAP